MKEKLKTLNDEMHGGENAVIKGIQKEGVL